MTNLQAIQPEMVVVPDGPFRMGSNRETDSDSKYSQEPDLLILTLPKFFIGKYEVTVAEYRPFVDMGGYRLGEEIWGHFGWVWCRKNRITQPSCWIDPVLTGDERLPVSGVCWYEAMAYCRWLSSNTCGGYRLPTEAEWEKAARGTDGQIYPWGDTFEASRCNSGRKWYNPFDPDQRMYDFTMPVGSYPEGVSPCGAMDMSGNVQEWCQDKNVNLYRYPDYADPRWHPENRDPDHPSDRILRGGDFHSKPYEVRAAARHYLPPESQGGGLGFRVAFGSSG